MGENKFAVCKEVKVNFEIDGEQQEAVGWKGLVDADNTANQFNIVSSSYKVAQHDDVANTVDKALEDLGLKPEVLPIVCNNGARLQIRLRFPEIKLGLGDDIVSMVAHFDNSYDSTSGLKLEIGAYQNEYVIYVGGSYARYYHRHTKGLQVSSLEKSINRGIEAFQKKVKVQLEGLVNTKVDPLVFGGWLNDQIDKVDGDDEGVQTHKSAAVIPIKYLKAIKGRFDEVRGNMTNLWSIYNMVCQTLHNEGIEKMDRLPALCRSMYDAIVNEFKK